MNYFVGIIDFLSVRTWACVVTCVLRKDGEDMGEESGKASYNKSFLSSTSTGLTVLSLFVKIASSSRLLPGCHRQRSYTKL